MGNLMKISTRRSCSIATEHIENIQCFITEATINVSFSIAMSQDQMASLPSGNLLHSYWTWPSRNSEFSLVFPWEMVDLSSSVCNKLITTGSSHNIYQIRVDSLQTITPIPGWWNARSMDRSQQKSEMYFEPRYHRPTKSIHAQFWMHWPCSYLCINHL